MGVDLGVVGSELLGSGGDASSELGHGLLVGGEALLGSLLGGTSGLFDGGELSLDLGSEGGGFLLGLGSAGVGGSLLLGSRGLVLGQVKVGLGRSLGSSLVELALGLVQLAGDLGGISLLLTPLGLNSGGSLSSLLGLGLLSSLALLEEHGITIELPATGRSSPLLLAVDGLGLRSLGRVWEPSSEALHEHGDHVTDGASTTVGLEAAGGTSVLVHRHVGDLLLPHRDVGLEARVLGVRASGGQGEPQVKETLGLLATGLLGGLDGVELHQRSASLVGRALLAVGITGSGWDHWRRRRRRRDVSPGHAAERSDGRGNLAAGDKVGTHEWALGGGLVALSALEAVARSTGRDLGSRDLGGLLLLCELLLGGSLGCLPLSGGLVGLLLLHGSLLGGLVVDSVSLGSDSSLLGGLLATLGLEHLGGGPH